MKLKSFFIICLIFLLSSKLTMNNSYGNVDVQNNEISFEMNVYCEIIKMNIKFPNIVFTQCLLETGYFTSDLYYNENNLFGMKHPKIRKTTSIGPSKSGYATYNSWIESIEDYSLWQETIINSNLDITEEQYLKLLSKIYSEDKNYINKIKSIIISIEPLKI
jgi:uncharacterized FlgJ-related protein